MINITKNKNSSINLFKFMFITSKTKFKRLSQPGLTRYNWDQQDYETESSDRSKFTHCSNAEELIKNVPPIEVDDDTAMCYVSSYLKFTIIRGFMNMAGVIQLSISN